MSQPKKIFRPVGFRDAEKGFPRRVSYGKTITYKAPEFPKPLEYEDIDNAFNEFADKAIDLVDDEGKRVPTFTLYSNQRFSEYSQTWEHTDEDGNLLMNFKTVNRSGNPSQGSGHANSWNIPGERRYTTHLKTVLDEDGTEHVEVYSMKQPYWVDLMYRINFVTNTFEMLNTFNERIHELFKARQCYIRPNGHFIPMILDGIDDQTNYSIEERKFFVQSVKIKAMAYIIHESDFNVKKYAKDVKLYDTMKKPKNTVEIEEKETDPEAVTKQVELNISFSAGESSVEFDIDTDMEVMNGSRDNIFSVRVSVNGTPTFIEKGFSLKEGDTVKVRIVPADPFKPASLKFFGTVPNHYVNVELSESVKDDEPLVDILNV